MPVEGARDACIWRVGDPTLQADPFSAGPAFTSDVDEIVFKVGRDDPRTCWPRYHPGPLSAYTDYKEKRLRVIFELAGPPVEDLVLRVKLRAVQGPCPDLELDLNGQRGRYFPEPNRADRTGLSGGTLIIGTAEIVARLPKAALLAGENVLTLTAVASTPADPSELRPAHHAYPPFWGSAFEYVVVSLEQPPPAHEAAPSTTSVRVQTLPLYIERDDQLHELVDVVVTTNAGFTTGSVSLHVESRTTQHALEPGGRCFGEFRARVPIPEFATPAGATVDVVIDGVSHESRHELVACRKWTVHLLPHVHLDIGYTDFQGKVAELHSRNVDRTLRVLRDNPDYAYSADGSYVVQQFLSSRSTVAAEALLAAIKAGRVSMNAFYALFLTGLASLEECYRAGYQSAVLRRAHDVRVDYANLTDVPSYSSAIPSVLAAMGIDAFLGIQNHARAANEDSDELHLASPFTWEGPDGAQVLTYFADGYGQLRAIAGYPATVAGLADGLIRMARRYERDDYLPTDLPVVGFYSDNEDMSDGDAELAARWHRTYAYPKVRYSTISQFFDALRPLADRLPIVRGDGGSYWEDGVGSAARAMAVYRRAQVALPAAEACATLLAAAQPDLAPALRELDRGWEGLLIGCEHTWTSVHATDHPHSKQSVDQLEWKEHQIATAARIAVDETRRALSQLAELVTTDGPGIIVWNALSWPQSGVVEVELSDGSPPRSGFEVLPHGAGVTDAEGHSVPSEVIAGADGQHTLRFVAADVPSFGYRYYPLVEGEQSTAPRITPTPEGFIDTPRYRMRVDRGRIVGLYSKRLDHELVDSASGYGLAELLYVSGGGTESERGLGAERTTITDALRDLPEPTLLSTGGTTRLAGAHRTPWGHRVRLAGTAPSITDFGVELELHDDSDRIDVTVRMRKEPVLAKESVYLAFPFAVPDATVVYDRQQGWVDPARDHTPGACNEWLTTQYAVGVYNDDLAITWTSLDAPLLSAGDIVRARWPREFDAGAGALFSWVMNNYWWVNYPASQGGDLTLRYSFEPTRQWDPARAARFGRQARTALTPAVLTWLEKMDTEPRMLPASGCSLLRVDAPDNVVVTVGAARVRAGILVRVQELAGTRAQARIAHPLGRNKQATLCTALEDDIAPLPISADGMVTVDVSPFEVVSLILAEA